MAEVKVKITASNQTQTGFQSVLADAQKTAAQVQQTMSKAAPDAGMPRQSPQQAQSSPQEVMQDLRQAREEAKTTAAEIENIPTKGGGLIGRLFGAGTVAVTAGLFAKQKVEQVAQEYNRLIDLNAALDSSFKAISGASTFEGIISGAKKAQEQIANIAKETEAFKSGFFNNVANFFTGGQLFANADKLVEDAGKITVQEVIAALKQQNRNLTEQIAGAKEGRLDQVESQQQKKRQRDNLQTQLRSLGATPEQIAQGLAAFDRQGNLQQQKQFAQQDFEARQKLQERQRREEERNKARLSPGTRIGNVVGRELGPGNIQGIKNFEREQMRQAEEAARAVLAGSSGGASFQGGVTASSLQRIGFASSEFRDTRSKEDPAKSIPKIADLVKEIVTQLKNGEPLVLAGTK